MPADDTPFIRHRRGRCQILLRQGVTLDTVMSALQTPGEILKQSHKTTTRRVHEWIIKESRFQHGTGPLKMTCLREKYRRAWHAAIHMEKAGIHVPKPIAWLEWTFSGAILKNCFISANLHGCRNVEHYARALTDTAAQRQFLNQLAGAVNQLPAAGVWHTDLSGKNIFTQDGQTFWFIDLDGVILGQTINHKHIKINHIQLYDSFCDFFDAALMEGFVAAMTPPDADNDAWLRDVRHGQQTRRDHHNLRKKRP